MKRGAITQKEIAARLGVSVATVSRALNDQGGVSPELRQQILELMRQEGYAPDTAARNLATARAETIAFVMHQHPQLSNDDPFYSLIMAGAAAELARHGYHILLALLDDETMAHPQHFAIVQQRRVDGLILAGPDIAPSFILHMLARDIPLVLVDNSLTQTDVDAVIVDDAGGAATAVRHLLDLGHRHIVCLSGPETWHSNRERVAGYRQVMEMHGLTPRITRSNETTIASGEASMAEALATWPDLTAVFAINDSMAIGAIRIANQHGRRVPEDLAVVGFDDIRWAELCAPPLTTVHVFKRRMGQLAAQRLLDRLAERSSKEADTSPSPSVRIIVGAELVVRESCGAALRKSNRHTVARW